MSRGRIAIVCVSSSNGERGGAERFYERLQLELEAAGADSEIIYVISNETDINTVKETYLRFYDLSLSKFDAVISTKAPSYMVRHPNHVCFLVHTMRVFYDMFEREFPDPRPELIHQRRLIQALDTGSLLPPKTKKVFCIGHTVKERLLRYNNVTSEVLHMDLPFNLFRSGSYDYAFLPGRLHRWKRVDLVISAMRHVNRPLHLKISGTGEQEQEFRELAGDDYRIEFLGRVSDRELVELYANALIVPFVPVGEDLGLITLEAFRSSTPVLTCNDSGEPTYFVRDGYNGFICQPDPVAIARKLELAFDYPETAASMGRNGMRSISHLSWQTVSDQLLRALEM